MNSIEIRTLYRRYRSAVAYVAVRKPDGDAAIGTAFHVGEGVFVTARHVVEGNEILEVGITEETHNWAYSVFPAWAGSLEIDVAPRFHPDPQTDLAVFRVHKIHAECPVVPLGTHIDDWLDETLVLTEALVLGYPPIPFTNEPLLVVARAEINSIIRLRGHQNHLFVLSAMPRGGFSGGLAISEYDYALGIILESLVMNNAPSEIGFFAVLSVEPIYVCLAHNKMLPDCQKGFWQDFWNTESISYCKELDSGAWLSVVSVSIHDDGRNPYIEIISSDPEKRRQAVAAALAAIEGCIAIPTEKDHIVRVVPPRLQSTTESIAVMAAAVGSVLEATGLIRRGSSRHPS